MTEFTNVISAFTAQQVTAITGLSMGQLAYWDKTEFFRPQYADENRRSPYARIYSFKDVVGLRTLSVLRNGYSVSLPHLREVAEKLASYSATPWADLKLAVWKRKVQFVGPDGKAVGVVDGQYALLPIIEVINDVKREAERLRQRDPSEIGKFEKHRYVAHNAEVVAGTRVRVSAILNYVRAGYSPEQIIKEYPSLTKEDIEAAIRQDAHRAA